MVCLPLDVNLVIFSMLSPYELFVIRTVSRAWKSACEEAIITKFLQLTGFEDEVKEPGSHNKNQTGNRKRKTKKSQIDFQYILENYSALLKFPFTASPPDNSASRNTKEDNNKSRYFYIEDLESGQGILKSSEHVQKFPGIGSYLNWAPLDYEPDLRAAKKIIVARIIRSLGTLRISILERGELREGIDIFQHWPVLREIGIPVDVAQPGCMSIPAIEGIYCGRHTFQFAIQPELGFHYHIISDIRMTKVLFIQDLDDEMQTHLCERHGFIVWTKCDKIYAVGNPSWITDFEDIDGYWLVSYWQHVIENSLIWSTCDDAWRICPLNDGQTYLIDKGAIAKFHDIPGSTFNEYYSTHDRASSSPPLSSSSSSSSSSASHFLSRIYHNSYGNKNCHIAEPRLPSWDDISKLNFTTVGYAMSEHVRKSWTCRGCFLFHGKSYACYENKPSLGGTSEYKQLIVDLSESGLTSILSNHRFIVYHCTTQGYLTFLLVPDFIHVTLRQYDQFSQPARFICVKTDQ